VCQTPYLGQSITHLKLAEHSSLWKSLQQQMPKGRHGGTGRRNGLKIEKNGFAHLCMVLQSLLNPSS
jgi:hypothetical protein